MTSLRPVALALALFAAGCQTLEVEHRAPGFAIRGSQRVAVLPFQDEAEGDFGLAVPLGAMMDIVPFLSDEGYERAHAARILRHKLTANLRRTPLEVLSPWVVDAQLRALPAEDLAGLEREALARRVGAALGVDLVVFGQVGEWDRNYVLVASWVSVALGVEVRDGRSGALLFTGNLSDTETAGLHKGMIATEPVEVVVIAVGETLRGLRNTLFATLSDDVSRGLVDELRGSRGSEEARPPAPTIEQVGLSRRGEEVFVVLLGSPGAHATVRRIGGEPAGLVESYPGVYRGTLWLPPGQSGPQACEVVLKDALLQQDRARLELPAAPARIR